MSVNDKIDAMTINPLWKICKTRASLLLKSTSFSTAVAVLAIFVLPENYSTTMSMSEAKILPSRLNPLYLLDGVSPHTYDDKFKELNLTPAMALNTFLQFLKQQELISIETTKTSSNPDSFNIELRSHAPSINEFQLKVKALLDETSNRFLDQRNHVIQVWITKENIERRHILKSVAQGSSEIIDNALELKSNWQPSNSFPVVMNQCNDGDQECLKVTLPLQIAQIFSTETLKLRNMQISQEKDRLIEGVALQKPIDTNQLDLNDFIFVLDIAKPKRQFAFHLIPLGLLFGLMIGFLIAVFMEYNRRSPEDLA